MAINLEDYKVRVESLDGMEMIPYSIALQAMQEENELSLKSLNGISEGLKESEKRLNELLIMIKNIALDD